MLAGAEQSVAYSFLKMVLFLLIMLQAVFKNKALFNTNLADLAADSTDSIVLQEFIPVAGSTYLKNVCFHLPIFIISKVEMVLVIRSHLTASYNVIGCFFFSLTVKVTHY